MRTDFEERVVEVDAYIDLVSSIEHSIQAGVPLIKTRSGASKVVEPMQQKLLCAGVYLHLYNLVEATVSRCIAAVERAATESAAWNVGDLSAELRGEWVRSMAKTHENLSVESRLDAALNLCNHLVRMLPVRLSISQGGGGNWDDEEIFRFTKRIGVPIRFTPETQRGVKQPIRNDKGAMQLVRHLRNKLAHGELSFSECGEGLTAADLTKIKDCTVVYLSEVIDCYEGFLTRFEYVVPEKRPQHAG
nr:MAE_28990/MAE_18760 family HEPN-like nuclease [Corallococcus exercitus]